VSMQIVNLWISFVAGVLSFFSPCMVPLMPVYISFVSGVSLAKLRIGGIKRYRKTLFLSTLLYVLGFSIVFVLLGAAAAGVSGWLKINSLMIRRVGGALIILFGLEFAGVLRIPFLEKEHKFKLPKGIQKLGIFRALLVGMIFGVSWTPCAGVVLGSILVLAASTATVWQGATMLFAYSLGISIPFLIISLFLLGAPKYLGFLKKYTRIISVASGLFLVLLGVLLFTDLYNGISSWLFEVAFRFGYKVR
jgi:cytochrome c-type biogenesis protein